MKLLIHVLLFILYAVFGIIASPFLGLFLFVTSLPLTWRNLRQAKVKKPVEQKEEQRELTLQDLKDGNFTPKDVSFFYNDKWGEG
jgi:hypothetical protein